jgi:hypothetical protein
VLASGQEAAAAGGSSDCLWRVSRPSAGGGPGGRPLGTAQHTAQYHSTLSCAVAQHSCALGCATVPLLAAPPARHPPGQPTPRPAGSLSRRKAMVPPEFHNVTSSSSRGVLGAGCPALLKDCMRSDQWLVRPCSASQAEDVLVLIDPGGGVDPPPCLAGHWPRKQGVAAPVPAHGRPVRRQAGVRAREQARHVPALLNRSLVRRPQGWGVGRLSFRGVPLADAGRRPVPRWAVAAAHRGLSTSSSSGSDSDSELVSKPELVGAGAS